MLIDLSQAVGAYLHEVFVAKFQWIVLLGYVAQIMFTMRFVVQWIASERAGKMVMPIAFWFFSIGGGVLLFGYALYIRDPVFILGQGFGVFVYALLGLWGANTAWKVAPRLPGLPTEDMRRQGLESLAVSHRLDLAAARQATEAQARSVGLARVTALFPDGVFGGEAEREPEGEWSAGPAIEFSTPIFDQGQAAVAKAVAELRERQRRYAALAVHIRSQVRRSATRMESARRRVEYFETVVLPLRQQIVERTQLQYNAIPRSRMFPQ